MASHLLERQKLLVVRGETVLQKVLMCSLLLRDPESAASIYQEFKELREKNGRSWKPGKKTQERWRDVLTLNKDEAA